MQRFQKISDFGMEKICLLDQTHDNTSKIAGTYGYMTPEYAMQGRYSIRTDVFSYGVLVLEIVTSHGNIRNGEYAEHLPSKVWKNWLEGTAADLIDPMLSNESRKEMMKCIHIGLLCMQENEAERPSMSSVVLMLNNSSSPALSPPSKPAFFMSMNPKSVASMQNSSVSKGAVVFETVNGVSISDFYPR